MSDNINRADVSVNLRDVYGQSISDEVEITFYNQKVHSLSQKFTVKFKGAPAVLTGVPAFPTGLAEVFIKPKRYRYKSIFINVVGGDKNAINEDLFVDPDKARPTLMDFDDLPSKLYGADLRRILQKSKVDKKTWDGLDKRSRATVLNLCAKMLKEMTKDGQTVISQVESIVGTMLDKNHRERIYAGVNDKLIAALRKSTQRFRGVSSALHHFPAGWGPASQPDSFKTRDSAGNVQLTFATNAAGAYLADIDLDDHSGVEHAADVLRHKITGKDTDPYDIHQILVYFQQLDPGYRLL
ncbi:MAG TPA: hypothetical protein VF588_03095 [Pyrinomonadaceae bacterium]